ncbi:MAG: DNA internalization-related competence protein ComEC/Rec2 [Oscillospiraceae bacterium]|nr:DNA internalization-related competence protein ComEC/Rec2 [Oscillospiraceae bacterium]
MRILATFCFSFAFGVFTAEYLLPNSLLPYAAAGCAVLGVLWALILRDNARKRALLIGFGLALALIWSFAYAWVVHAPYEKLAGTKDTFLMELADYPSSTDYGYRAEVRLRKRGLLGKAVLYGDSELEGLEPGTWISAYCEIRSSSLIRGSKTSTHTSRGVYALLYARGDIQTCEGNAGSARYFPQRVSYSISDVIKQCFPDETAPLINAILLGDRYELSDGDKTLLSETGLYHVTAVSGLHCAFLLSIIVLIVGRHRRGLLVAVAVPVLTLYAMLVGLSPSVVRACVMLILTIIAPLFKSDSDPLTSLSFALFLILAANPFSVKSISLQLSFAAMLGLILLTSGMYDRLRNKKRGKAAWFLLGSLCATAGAMVFTAPLSAAYFNTLVLAAPISNLLCLWAATLTFSAGLIAVLVGLFSPAAAGIIACVPHLGASYLLWTARLISKLPWHAVSFSNSYLKFWLVYVYAIFVVCAVAKSGKAKYAAASALAVVSLAFVLWLNAFPMRSGSLHVVTLDVGQGQCVVLYSRGSAAMIDCGSKSYGNAGTVAADYLRSIAVDRLESVVLSHYHSDHSNGLGVLLARVDVGELVLPDIEEGDELRAEVLSLAQKYGVNVRFIYETETIPLGSAEIKVFPPASEVDMNEECLSVLCTAGTFDALFTGDMDANTEYLLIAKNELPDVEMLMAGHHGSRWSTGGDLLAEVTPEIAVISCGVGNSYGHPHQETLYALRDAGIEIFRTDLQGSIHIKVD